MSSASIRARRPPAAPAVIGSMCGQVMHAAGHRRILRKCTAVGDAVLTKRTVRCREVVSAGTGTTAIGLREPLWSRPCNGAIVLSASVVCEAAVAVLPSAMPLVEVESAAETASFAEAFTAALPEDEALLPSDVSEESVWTPTAIAVFPWRPPLETVPLEVDEGESVAAVIAGAPPVDTASLVVAETEATG